MPKRTDLSSILIIGSGPIVIGQACEFDYSGTQACRVLKEEGYRVILANSNPATIMTDPDFADRTYIEPLTWEVVARIIEREKPDAVLPTLGGQTGLNTAMALFERGLVGVPGTPELIGANAEAIATAEDRDKFKQAMLEIGLSVPPSGIAHSMDEARKVIETIGLPAIIRPAYILGGRGTGIASTPEQFETLAANGLAASPINEILIEKSIAGWKEYELEVMRDRADNCVIICSIENFDPMGVHTGDSITVAPAQTLSDVEYQRMRDAAFACIRRVGVETGGSNVQFAVNPSTGDQVVIEMNPRVSRSSALASKATGFPIAKIAAKLAVGYTLDEIPNDITRATPASFEPTIDYVVTKIPRWAFEKLPGTSGVLGTQMQSVGEVMSIGRTFPESLQKALRSLEQGRLGLGCDPAEQQLASISDDQLLAMVAVPTPERIFQIGELLRRGVSIDRVHEACRVDPWFLDQMSIIVEERAAVADAGFETVMVNCNPETVSTDYDTSDRLYFEPLTKEDVLNVIAAETAAAGGRAPKVIVSLGGQTPLKLSGQIPVELIAGTSPASIDLAEDREKWNALCESLNIPQPPGGTAVDLQQALEIVDRVGFPVLVRPSYVLGGRAMQIVHDRDHLARAMAELSGFGSLGKEGGLSAERPVLVDRFLEDATEVDVDAIRDHTGEVIIGGVMEHVEEAGVHSGDSACAIPPQTLPSWVVEVIESYTAAIATALDVRGLINVQYAVAGTNVYVIEANPRASRTVPFVAKATGVPLAKVATRVMLGATLNELRSEGLLSRSVLLDSPSTVAVKEAVLPFNRFPEVDTALGPEMRSTGEVMGIDNSFGKAFYKAELAAGTVLPSSGTVFLSLADGDKPAGIVVAKRLRELGFGIVATPGTADYLGRFGHMVDAVVGKVS
ncbi:MAG: carbamoyl-phosphate synthase large subunit, partial [Acidimicrobiia bacterium]|nr:carbamoyl-phosphate synthase large subunit [Acidimicrobiia bacterium]